MPAGAHPAGQLEWHWLLTQQGAPSFPQDWPDTPAAARLAAAQQLQVQAAAEARPLGRARRAGAAGWAFADWARLGQAAGQAGGAAAPRGAAAAAAGQLQPGRAAARAQQRRRKKLDRRQQQEREQRPQQGREASAGLQGATPMQQQQQDGGASAGLQAATPMQTDQQQQGGEAPAGLQAATPMHTDQQHRPQQLPPAAATSLGRLPEPWVVVRSLGCWQAVGRSGPAAGPSSDAVAAQQELQLPLRGLQLLSGSSLQLQQRLQAGALRWVPRAQLPSLGQVVAADRQLVRVAVRLVGKGRCLEGAELAVEAAGQQLPSTQAAGQELPVPAGDPPAQQLLLIGYVTSSSPRGAAMYPGGYGLCSLPAISRVLGSGVSLAAAGQAGGSSSAASAGGGGRAAGVQVLLRSPGCSVWRRAALSLPVCAPGLSS